MIHVSFRHKSSFPKTDSTLSIELGVLIQQILMSFEIWIPLEIVASEGSWSEQFALYYNMLMKTIYRYYSKVR